MEVVSIDDGDDNKGKNLKRKQSFGDEKQPKKQKPIPKNLKRKQNFDYEYTPPSLIHVPKNHLLFDSYSLYKKLDIKIHGENECSYLEQDKTFHLSGILSYQMHYNFFNEYENKIELVSTNEIWKFKEYDRFVEPKFEGDDPIKEIDKKCNSILTHG